MSAPPPPAAGSDAEGAGAVTRGPIRRFLAHEGGPPLLIGLTWCSLWLGLIAALHVVDRARFLRILPAFVAEATFGKEASVPAALASGEPVWIAAGVIVVWDIALLFVGLGLFLLLRDGAASLPLIGRWFARRENEEAARGRFAEGIGVTGLALTVWIPFSPAGALTASIVGVILGFPARVLLPIMTVSVSGAAIFYTLVTSSIFTITGTPPPWASWAIAGACLVFVAAAALTGWIKSKQNPRPEE